jgi:hypothetical protein
MYKMSNIQDNEGLEFEDRSDYLRDEDIINWNVPNDFFQTIQNDLLSTGSKLLEGPRGTGKTHQMKIAYHKCITKGDNMPFAIFVTLNKYFHLEPLLTKDANAIRIFHSWVLSKIVIGTCDFIAKVNPNYEVSLEEFYSADSEITLQKLNDFESIVESPYSVEQKNYDLSININISNVSSFIERVTKELNRKRAIILLDDAALTLTPDYFVEFLDIFRSLKTKTIAPKASVYPGTTQYSPRFHVGHDAQIVDCWMSVENEKYDDFMTSLLQVRFSSHISTIGPEIIDIIKYASFGVPRTLIGLLRAFQASKSIEKTTQSRFNSVIAKRSFLMETEYLSLKKKMLQYEDIISAGWTFFKTIIGQIKEANKNLTDEKLIEIGILEEDQKMPNRMLGFLKEAGLLFEIKSTVKHGEQREYKRFIPHILFLIENRSFSKGRGFNAHETLSLLKSKARKHPLRRTVATVLSKEDFQKLKLNLPPCQSCGMKRLTEDQKFCHNCGSQLLNKSAFEECMSMLISELPLTDWQKSKLNAIQIKTIGDFLSLANPGGELRKARGIGKVKSEKISNTIQAQVNEILEKALIDFLS